MNIIPAIDLKDGVCVRLLKGDFATAHRVAEDPVKTAAEFLEAGAELIHMVDLDGALTGSERNRRTVAHVIRETGAQVELGGGIRTMRDIDEVLKLGVTRAILGSAAVSDPELVTKAIGAYGDRIAVGVDALDGIVKTRGWTENSGLDYLEFAKRLEQQGVKCIIFTDIDSDGTLRGPAFERLFALRSAVRCEIVASGGVSSLDDLEKLDAGGIESAILGKAVYAGTIDLAAAVARFRGV